MSTSTLTVAIANVSIFAFTIAVAITNVSVNVDTNGCSCNRYCTLSTISGAHVDNMCIINAYCSQYFLTLDTRFIDPLIDFLSKYRRTQNGLFVMSEKVLWSYFLIFVFSLNADNNG